jgi:Tfp pilus assembly protein PilZ
MRRRPWSLIVLAVLHFLAPLGNIIMNALMTGRNVAAYFIYALSPEYLALNWPILLLPIVGGVAIYACQKWSFFVYLMAQTSLFIFSYSGYLTKSEKVSGLVVFLIYIINVSLVAYILLPAVRRVYFDRRLRWWEIQPRYRCFYRCRWKTNNDGQEQTGVVGNFSQGGLFLQSPEFPQDGAEIYIQLPLQPDLTLSLVGRVIIHQRADAIGFGVQFSHTQDSQKMARRIVRELEAQGMRMSGIRDRPEDRFSYWVRMLITTGKGLLPKKDS